MKNLAFFLSAIILIFTAACAPLRSIKYLAPSLNDSSKFQNVRIEHSKQAFFFTNNFPNNNYGKLKEQLDTALENTKTNVFLVIKKDSIIYLYLGPNTSLSAIQPSFSLSKSFVGTLVGMALERGYIQSTADLVIKYLPELANNDTEFQRLSIQHLLDMEAGFRFNERSFSPFSRVTQSYYGTNLKKMVGHLKMKFQPGDHFEYQSISTQVLAFILERTTGKSIAYLLQNWLWTPLGIASDALWSVDDNGNIKAFCCISATATDYAKLGRLYLHKGNWNGKQILSKNWVESSTHPDTLSSRPYKNQIWSATVRKYFSDSTSAIKEQKQLGLNTALLQNKKGQYYFNTHTFDFTFRGMYNQIVYVNPINEVIIVRLGDMQKKVNLKTFIPKIGRAL